MTFSYRFPGEGNSGVSIRAAVDETRKRDFKSYHADLGHKGIGKNVMGAWDFHTPGRREHRCFRGDNLVILENDEPKLTEIKNGLTADDIYANQWNHVHIIARDNNFKLIINGKLSSEFTEYLPNDKRLDRGMIQLQLHDPGMVVEFQRHSIKNHKVGFTGCRPKPVNAIPLRPEFGLIIEPKSFVQSNTQY